jgi:hypothetical protein
MRYSIFPDPIGVGAHLFVQLSYRREAPISGMPSLKEIVRMVLANFYYRLEEREAHFQHNWDQLGIGFAFT